MQDLKSQIIDGEKITSPTFHGMDVTAFLQAVNEPLSKGDRAEVMLGKDGIKVLRVSRDSALSEKALDNLNRMNKETGGAINTFLEKLDK